MHCTDTTAPPVVTGTAPFATSAVRVHYAVSGLSQRCRSAVVGGLLYGILKGWEAEKWPKFGWATGVLAASSLNDYGEPADEKQVWDIYAGNARVQR